jgi:hypothetical protein
MPYAFDEIRLSEEPGGTVVTLVFQDKLKTEDYAYFVPQVEKIMESRDKIRMLIQLKNIRAVYVEDIVEIAENPEAPVITRFQSSEGPFPRSVSCALPASETDDFKAFQWVSDDGSPVYRNGDAQQEYKEAVPFIEFS